MRSVIAAHLESLLFLLLIAVALLFQVLTRMAGKANKDESKETSASSRPEMPPPVRRAPTESDQERIRKFLEALGQPATTRPPPPVAPRTDIPPRPLAPVQPPTPHIPRGWTLTREERRKPDITQRESSPLRDWGRSEKVFLQPIKVAPAVEVHAVPLPVEHPLTIKSPFEAYAAVTPPAGKDAGLKTDIATLLASKSGLRDAIVLREIFGPPRSLQPLDLIPNT